MSDSNFLSNTNSVLSDTHNLISNTNKSISTANNIVGIVIACCCCCFFCCLVIGLIIISKSTKSTDKPKPVDVIIQIDKPKPFVPIKSDVNIISQNPPDSKAVFQVVYPDEKTIFKVLKHEEAEKKCSDLNSRLSTMAELKKVYETKNINNCIDGHFKEGTGFYSTSKDMFTCQKSDIGYNDASGNNNGDSISVYCTGTPPEITKNMYSGVILENLTPTKIPSGQSIYEIDTNNTIRTEDGINSIEGNCKDYNARLAKASEVKYGYINNKNTECPDGYMTEGPSPLSSLNGCVKRKDPKVAYTTIYCVGPTANATPQGSHKSVKTYHTSK